MLESIARPLAGALLGLIVLTSRTATQEPKPAGSETRREESVPGPAFVAFRVDAHRVIATLVVTDIAGPQIREGLSAAPPARFGYQHFEPPASWLERVPAAVRDARQWVVHGDSGQPFAVVAERVVGGHAQCTEALGVLLRIGDDRAAEFAALPARYFVASPAAPRGTAPAAVTDPVRALPPPVFTTVERKTFESILNKRMSRELPLVRAESEDDLARMEAGPGRATARDRRQMDETLGRGRAELRYDIQSFRLAPDGVPLHFVRAEWTVRGRHAFAMSLWMRGAQPADIVETNVRPASWLRMSEFQGRVAREHLGLVLNVVDRDHDGWGEVLFARAGYESLGISLMEYSPSGFKPADVTYACGC